MRSCTLGGATRVRLRSTNHFMAILTGVVRHAVNRSAGSSGFMGRLWPAAQAASWMQFLYETLGGAPSAPLAAHATCGCSAVTLPSPEPRSRPPATYLVVSLVLVGELLEVLDDHAGVGAVVHVQRRRAHPRLQVVHRQGNVLCVRL